MTIRLRCAAPVVAGVIAAVLASGVGSAVAHVSIGAPDAAAGGLAELAFRVPDESDTAEGSTITEAVSEVAWTAHAGQDIGSSDGGISGPVVPALMMSLVGLLAGIAGVALAASSTGATAPREAGYRQRLLVPEAPVANARRDPLGCR